jgi:hypothetical protein
MHIVQLSDRPYHSFKFPSALGWVDFFYFWNKNAPEISMLYDLLQIKGEKQKSRGVH